MCNVLKVKLDEGAYAPERAHKEDAGLDLRSPFDVFVKPKDSAVVDTGVHVQIPEGYAGFLKSKSGLNVKLGLVSEGVIDSGYSGSIVVKLYNHSDEAVSIQKGNKLTQLVVLPVSLCGVEVVDEIKGSERGNKGFGSTGQ